MEVERRITLSDASVEYRDGENGEKKAVISGYAAVFNSESRILNGFVETIHPSAFDEVLSTNPDVIGVFNHDRNLLLGRTSNGTMRLSADAYGLRYEISPNEKTSIGKDVVEWVKDRTVVGSSFAFAVRKDGTGDSWQRGADGMQRREVRKVALLEDCGPVVRPAYPAASVVVSRRALEMALGENFRPTQTMANAAKRGLKLAERTESVDQNLVAIAERMAGRQVVSVEECEYLAAVYERCLASKAKGWNGSAAWVEWQLAGGDTGQRWTARRVVADDSASRSSDAPASVTASLAASAAPETPESRADSGLNLTPTAGMRSACRRGLKLYEEGRGGDGLVGATISWAKKIAAGEALSEEKVIKMAAWHARHKVDKRPGWDKAGEESPGFVAFLLWAGAAGARWSQAKAARLKETRDLGDDAVDYESLLDERQLATAEAYEGIAEEMGPWPQLEAHYVADNPFAAKGIACRNCVFFEAEGRCYVVAGEIAQDAVCKLWVIPEDRMSDEPKTEDEKPATEENSAPAKDEVSEAVAKAAALKAILLSTQLHGAPSAS